MPDIAAALEQAEKRGPPGIAELARLCLVSAGAWEEHRTGPEGLAPVEYLLRVLDHVPAGAEPESVTMARLSDEADSPPRPHAQPPQGVSDAEGRRSVGFVLAEGERARNPLERNRLLCEGLTRLARSGLTLAQLQPLVRLVIDAWSAKDDPFGHAPQALLYAGETEQAEKMLEAVPLSGLMGATIRSDFAKALAELHRFDEARRVLGRLWARHDYFHPGRLEDEKLRMAQVCVDIGDVDIARGLVISGPLHHKNDIERRIVRHRHLKGEEVDRAALLELARQAGYVQPLKDRAREQIEVLSLALGVGAREEAWRVLDRVQETLLSMGAWEKLEFRTSDAVGVLWPYMGEHPAPIFRFASGLLAGRARGAGPLAGAWPMTHAVSGLSGLIRRWAGEAEFRRLIDFLRSRGSGADQV